ncbi:hypothetical protein GCM10010228_39570 [Streptomyces massasporeus]|nr:hypothetical protein GCM10010228_39570 [Streptomyces massasporeus]
MPAPFLTGPQGAGKSTGGRMLVRIIEGMSGDLRRAPKDEENLIAAVAAGWVTALDNLSHMTPDLSDAMCCIVTGAENVKRALYTDGDVVRARYRRPMLLTGIDVGVIRPDLAERLLPLRLERPRVRRTEAELWAEYAEALPAILGSLLDLTVKVRAAEAETPTDLRMADFAHLCAQLDAATGLGALAAYRRSLDDLNDDVIEGDLLAQTVLKHAETIEPGGEQRMTSTEWLHCLSRLYSGDELRALPKGWPTTGKVLSDRLKRLQPTLAARGVLIESGRTSEGPLPRNDPPAGAAATRGEADVLSPPCAPVRSPDKQEEHHRPGVLFLRFGDCRPAIFAPRSGSLFTLEAAPAPQQTPPLSLVPRGGTLRHLRHAGRETAPDLRLEA